MGLRDWLHSIDPRKKSSAEGPLPGAPTPAPGSPDNRAVHDSMMTLMGDVKLNTQAFEQVVTKGWLEIVEGNTPRIHAVHGTCTIGRLRENTVCIPHERVSRRHAIIQVQGGEFWLVDLGTINGTFLNNKRLQMPCMLRDGDRVTIVACEMVFRQEVVETSSKPMGKYDDQPTMRAVEEPDMWLLLSDIEGFTPMSQRLGAPEMAQLVGTWLQAGRQIIDQHQGTVNKYLGDGYFAYWRHGSAVDRHVGLALGDLYKLQQKKQPPFRVVLHRGIVTVGGAAYAGEESILGPNVNMVFRLERLASKLRERCLLTAAALEHLPSLKSTRNLGIHQIDG
ncbi:MAG TPA: adenylate/guanylate cyclase domain-containing protein, partial [Candidatus Methylacidiphilales bacterium]|nr:adenylate/guanylate cyclase domain-containing protein [Candidatus Methylacidiphilales bacterium]